MRGVKKVQKVKFKKILLRALKDIGLKADDKILEDYWLYMNFLLKENKKYNLTGIKKPKEVIYKHFLDSLAPLPHLKIDKNSKIIDVGTGAGFPGLVLKIYKPRLKFVLLDSTLKKINFLNLLAIKLNINEGLETIHNRAEKLGQSKKYRESFDYVFSRAVAPLNILYEYTLPFIHKGGKAFFYKGPEFKNEIQEAAKSLSVLKGKISKTIELKVPGLKGKRFLVVISKEDNTPDSYPRRTGIAKKRPI